MWNIFKLGTFTIIKDQKNYKIFGSGDFTKRMIIEDKLCGFSIYLPQTLIFNLCPEGIEKNVTKFNEHTPEKMNVFCALPSLLTNKIII